MERDRTPEGRFTYLAEKRVEKTLRAIKSLSNLSDRKNYSYNQDQIDQIFDAIDAALESLKADFSRNSRVSTTEFQFKNPENRLMKGLSQMDV